MPGDRDTGRRAGRGWTARAPEWLLGVLLGLIGAWLALGGAWLLWLGGSAYYLIAGAGCLAAAWCYLFGRVRRGAAIYTLVFLGTWLWALAEVGSRFWLLLPRVGGPTVFAALVLVHYGFAVSRRRTLGWQMATAAMVAFAAFLISITRLPATSGGQLAGAPASAQPLDWTAFGQSQAGTRYSPAAQITPANVGSLELAWTQRTGDLPSIYPVAPSVRSFQATPLKVGDLVYVCTPHNVVIAMDTDTGKIRWRHDPKLDPTGVGNFACRGVSYYRRDGTDSAGLACAARILSGTLDARLIALDALTGRPCPGFGRNGEVALRDGLGVSPGGQYNVTSPPAIVNGIAVVGGFVLDGLQTDIPSGVVRGYDAMTGKLVWSWDSGAVDENRLPEPGGHYTRGSPNSWTVMSADPQLGLVYVPMGNATPDYVGMHRTKQHDRYSSAIVALDARTGKRRWHFQTVHHDLWDYDLGSQPVLFQMPMPGGGSAPALAQPTKQGDIFVLDRRTGTPLTEVAERPAPRGDVPTERYSPTQPRSIGFPSPIPSMTLRESDMWGATPLDQLLCRIRFRSARYAGRFTPPAVASTLQYPSNLGAMDWGSVSIGDGGRTMFVNSSEVPTLVELLPRAALERDGSPVHGFFSPQFGTPFAASPEVMLSPLGIPCNAPPWGRLTAIDLASRTVKWQRPLGTSQDHAPLGIAVPGAPNIAGSAATGGGVLFIGAAIDNYLRAFDTRSGKELWRARLPAGGQAAPISYVSQRTGRQYIVIAAGGHDMLGTKAGDYVMAFALPGRARK